MTCLRKYINIKVNIYRIIQHKQHLPTITAMAMPLPQLVQTNFVLFKKWLK